MKIYWNGERKNVIGSRVKELRKKQDISQKILAARLSLSGIDFTELTILRIEKGTRFVPDYELSVIADYFHVTSDYLLGRTNKEKDRYSVCSGTCPISSQIYTLSLARFG